MNSSNNINKQVFMHDQFYPILNISQRRLDRSGARADTFSYSTQKYIMGGACMYRRTLL